MKIQDKAHSQQCTWLYFHKGTQRISQGAAQRVFSQLACGMQAFASQLINSRPVNQLQSLIGVRAIVKRQLCTADPPADLVTAAT